jgi:hypothetical protein
MTNRTLNALAAVSSIAVAVLAMPATAEAGRGSAWGAGLAGFGLGAIVGSALTPRQVYVVPPPPPPPAYYGPVSYAPPPWTPDWYAYCGSHYRSFNPRTGYFMGYDGFPHFCQ